MAYKMSHLEQAVWSWIVETNTVCLGEIRLSRYLYVRSHSPSTEIRWGGGHDLLVHVHQQNDIQVWKPSIFIYSRPSVVLNVVCKLCFNVKQITEQCITNEQELYLFSSLNWYKKLKASLTIITPSSLSNLLASTVNKIPRWLRIKILCFSA